MCDVQIIVAVIAVCLGMAICGLAIRCAVLEERVWPQLQGEALRLSRLVFDGYRALSLLGAATVCVGMVDLLARNTTHETFPSGISWSVKVAALFFLALRVRTYRTEHGH